MFDRRIIAAKLLFLLIRRNGAVELLQSGISLSQVVVDTLLRRVQRRRRRVLANGIGIFAFRAVHHTEPAVSNRAVGVERQQARIYVASLRELFFSVETIRKPMERDFAPGIEGK